MKFSLGEPVDLNNRPMILLSEQNFSPRYDLGSFKLTVKGVKIHCAFVGQIQ